MDLRIFHLPVLPFYSWPRVESASCPCSVFISEVLVFGIPYLWKESCGYRVSSVVFPDSVILSYDEFCRATEEAASIGRSQVDGHEEEEVARH